MRALLITLGLLTGCGLQAKTVFGSGSPPPAVEGDRIAEAVVSKASSGKITHSIFYSGWFEVDDPIDLAVLREYCRPGTLGEITEAGTLAEYASSYMYTPRQITFSCN